MSESLYSALVQIAQANPGKACLLLEGGESISYEQLFDEVHRVAAVLRGCGVQVGERVVAHCEKTPLTLSLYIACLQVGAIYVPLNTSYTSSELAYFIGNAKPSVYVSSSTIEVGSEQQLRQFTINADGTGTLSEAVRHVATPYTDVAERKNDDIAAILYTSGTTGRSKGAMLTHRNLLSNAFTLNEVWGFREDDVLLHALPIYHVHGLFVAIHCVLLSGSSMIFQQRFDVQDVLRALPNATVLMGVPTFYTRLLAEEDFGEDVVGNMRLFISGSAPLTEQTFREFSQRTGMAILERYGMSETLMNTSNPLNGERKAGTVGVPLPGVSLRIADEFGEELATGEVGGIELRGPNVFKGYWEMPEKTAEEFRNDGYFITGDMGVQDEDGRVSIVGREKDVVISGGLNVYPAEVETAIGDLPEIADVAVIGAPHPDFGEGVVAVVVSSTERMIETQSVRAQLKNVLAGFKQPQRVETVAELPRNAMGKIQKNALREQFRNVFAQSGSTA